MRKIWIICKRELAGYFATPIAYVCMAVFVIASGVATFQFGNFFGFGQATLAAFFNYQPWLYAVFLPALAMRLWAEERRTGSIELLLTLPITPLQAILGKYFAACILAVISLALTSPLWIMVNLLGEPDNGVIFAGYLASIFLSAAYLAIGACISAFSKNQVICFVLTVLFCFALNLLSMTPWLDFLSNLENVARGLIELRTVVYFLSLIVFALFANAVMLELKRAD